MSHKVEGSCERLVALKDVAEASAGLASLSATSDKMVRAYGCILGIRCAKGMIRVAPSDKISGLVGRGVFGQEIEVRYPSVGQPAPGRPP